MMCLRNVPRLSPNVPQGQGKINHGTYMRWQLRIWCAYVEGIRLIELSKAVDYMDSSLKLEIIFLTPTCVTCPELPAQISRTRMHKQLIPSCLFINAHLRPLDVLTGNNIFAGVYNPPTAPLHFPQSASPLTLQIDVFFLEGFIPDLLESKLIKEMDHRSQAIQVRNKR